MKYLSILLSAIVLIGVCSCSKQDDSGKQLIIFHAGSLSMPLKEMKAQFEKENPGVSIVTQAEGSVTCARMISDLNKQCDVFMSADYKVIDDILIPKYASWNIKFASNQIVVAYTDKSKGSSAINENNWYKVLQEKGVVCGRSNPNDDPCGYRVLQMLKLASIYYKDKGMYDVIVNSHSKVTRPKETDLISLLQVGQIDYLLIYKSIAAQQGFKYIQLPPEVNLGDSKFTKYYQQVSVDITGNKPGAVITQKGEPMTYGLTIPKNAPNPELALKFVEFVLSKNGGLKIMEENGQPSVVPSPTSTYNELPEALKKDALQ